MKYSSSPKHFAPHKKAIDGKNRPGHRSHGGLKQSRPFNAAAAMVRLLFSKMSRRTRRVFTEQERAIGPKVGQ